MDEKRFVEAFVEEFKKKLASQFIKIDFNSKELSDFNKNNLGVEELKSLFKSKNITDVKLSLEALTGKEGTSYNGIVSLTKLSQAIENKNKKIDLEFLNKATEGEIEWEEESNGSLIPKRLFVLEVNKAFFARKLVFNSIHRTIKENIFSQKFSLYSQKSENLAPKKSDIENSLAQINSKLNLINNDNKFIIERGNGTFEQTKDSTSWSKKCTFRTAFKNNPHVIVSIDSLDFAPDVKVFCIIKNLNIQSFEYVCKTYPSTRNVVLTFSWIAISNNIIN